MKLPEKLMNAVNKTNRARKELDMAVENERKEILAWLGVKIGDTVIWQRAYGISSGPLRTPEEYIITGVKVVQPDFPEYNAEPFVSVCAKKKWDAYTVYLGRVNGIDCMNNI